MFSPVNLECLLPDLADRRCFGPKADICSAKGHVRFTPESDIICDIMECPPWANSGHRDRFRGQNSDFNSGPARQQSYYSSTGNSSPAYFVLFAWSFATIQN